ncbi:MAG TPA: hypothetical protein VFF88_04805, partial [Methylocella sp.]|nr:hypothetical protein [Methylocella sp.]
VAPRIVTLRVGRCAARFCRICITISKTPQRDLQRACLTKLGQGGPQHPGIILQGKHWQERRIV